MTSRTLAQIVTTIKMANSDAVIVAAGGVSTEKLSELAQLRFDNIAVGFNLNEKTVEASSKYLMQVTSSWFSEIESLQQVATSSVLK